MKCSICKIKNTMAEFEKHPSLTSVTAMCAAVNRVANYEPDAIRSWLACSVHKDDAIRQNFLCLVRHKIAEFLFSDKWQERARQSRYLMVHQ